VADDVVAILDEFLPYLLGVGDIHAVSYILREARTVTERAGRLEEGMRDRLAAFAAKISHPEALDQLLETLNESETLPADEDLAGLFAQLQPQALETVIMWLPRLESVRARELLGSTADQLAIGHPAVVSEILASEDQETVLAGLGLVTRLSLKIGGPEIEDLSSHNDTDVRRALADALGAVGTPEAMMQLESLLDDGAREVRIRAAKQVGHHPDALPRIEAIALGKPMRSKDLSEKRAFFETYGNLVGEKGVARLRPLLTKRLFRFRADPQTRACAAMALGEIGTAESVAVLEKAKKDKEPLVRAAVNEALKEIES
jgi:HEAT repeat protein